MLPLITDNFQKMKACESSKADPANQKEDRTHTPSIITNYEYSEEGLLGTFYQVSKFMDDATMVNKLLLNDPCNSKPKTIIATPGKGDPPNKT